MNINLFNYFFITVLIICLGGCSSQEKKKNRNVKDYYGKKAILPKNFRLINYYNADSVNFDIAGIKIVHWFDADCSICVQELNNYQIILEEIEDFIHVESFFIASTGNWYLLDYLLEQNQIIIPVYHDVYNEFYMNNNLEPDKRYHSFILNDNNEIIFVGNPIINESLHKNFIKILKTL